MAQPSIPSEELPRKVETTDPELTPSDSEPEKWPLSHSPEYAAMVEEELNPDLEELDQDRRPPDDDLTWIGRDSVLARLLARPLLRFLHIEASGGILLLVATAAALIWVNSPGGESYFDFWHTPVYLTLGNITIFDRDLHALVNDAFMALFFFVVGLEIKREIVTGRLSRLRNVMLPVGAAIGGMVVPALIYFAFNAGSENVIGWGIPMATDIAFAIGVVSLLGRRVPSWLKLFLLTLAIVDDIGSILVIAIFYTTNISFPWLFFAIMLCVLIAVCTRVRVWHAPIYVLLGVAVWWATFRSGVHATIAGVALGLLTPAKPLQNEDNARSVARWLERKKSINLRDIRRAGFSISESRSVAERLEMVLHPYVGYLIVPIFALANAGVPLSGALLRSSITSRVTLGVVLGLVVGKTVGVSFFTWLFTKIGLGSLPKGVNFLHVIGVSIVAGIGFTVSLFVTVLAFEEETDLHATESGAETEYLAPASENPLADSDANQEERPVLAPWARSPADDEAKIGVLAGSFIAFLGGLGMLWLASRRRETSAAAPS